MRFKDITVSLATYPDPTSPAELGRIVRLCRALGDMACGMAVDLNFPVKSNRLANLLIGLDDLARTEERRSRDQAHEVLAEFHRQAAELGLATSEHLLSAEIFNVAERVAATTRTRDLCVIPFLQEPAAQRGVAEGVIFGSGRPVVVFKAKQDCVVPARFERIAIAWDGGVPAARAVGDALPLISAAKEVQVVTILNEKPSAGPGTGAALVDHLKRHGVQPEPVEIDATGTSIGPALRRWLERDAPQLFVMGAFGHSRTKEFILGGATRDILDDPPIPVFLSH
jgi:nucleotide-binding universal stress UspA family protein